MIQYSNQMNRGSDGGLEQQIENRIFFALTGMRYRAKMAYGHFARKAGQVRYQKLHLSVSTCQITKPFLNVSHNHFTSAPPLLDVQFISSTGDP